MRYYIVVLLIVFIGTLLTVSSHALELKLGMKVRVKNPRSFYSEVVGTVINILVDDNKNNIYQVRYKIEDQYIIEFFKEEELKEN